MCQREDFKRGHHCSEPEAVTLKQPHELNWRRGTERKMWGEKQEEEEAAVTQPWLPEQLSTTAHCLLALA